MSSIWSNITGVSGNTFQIGGSAVYDSVSINTTTGVVTQNIVGGSSASYAWARAGTSNMKLGSAGFELVTDYTASHRVKSYQSSQTGAIWGLWHARGTEASPTTLLAGDVVGQITFIGHTNSFQNAGNITCEAESGWGATGADTPTRYVFRLPQDGTSTNSEMARMTSNGRMAVSLNGSITAPVGTIHANSDGASPQLVAGTSSILYWSQSTALITGTTTADITGGSATAAYNWNIAATNKASLSTSALTLSSVAINEAQGTAIASAATTDIGAATGNYVDVSGTTTITSLGTVQAGTPRTVRFTGILTLTHNATSLILPSAANITTAANDVAMFRSLGSGNWLCVSYTRAAGTALVSSGSGSPAGATTQIQFNNAGAFGADADFTYTTGTDTLGVKNMTMLGSLNQFQGTTIVSAATTDIGAATGNFIDVSGTTTITALGTVQAGTERTVRFTGILTLTYNATSLITHNGRDIVTAANDVATFRSLGSGNWICTNYSRANGSVDSANYVQIYSDNVATSLVVSRASTGTAGAGIFVQKARGTQTAKTSVVAGDTVGNFLFQGYNANTGGYETCANISAIIGTGAVGSAVDMPGKLAFWTTPDGTATQVKSFEIDELQRIVMLDAVNEFQGAAIASAATTDIGAATGNLIDVSGTTTITGLGTVQAGTYRVVRFTGILTLTYNATSLILPTAANITTAAGDVGHFRSLGSGNWLCVCYHRASGSALSGGSTPAGSNTQVQFNNSSAFGADADFTYTIGTDTLGVKNITMAGKTNEFQGATIASAASIDIGAATGNFLDVSGTTTITALGTVQAGTERVVRFTGALTLTHNATSLILPSAANITTAANDSATFRSLGSGNWICVSYSKASGSAVSSSGGGTPGGADTQVQYNSSGTFNGSSGFTFTGTANGTATIGTYLRLGSHTLSTTTSVIENIATGSTGRLDIRNASTTNAGTKDINAINIYTADADANKTSGNITIEPGSSDLAGGGGLAGTGPGTLYMKAGDNSGTLGGGYTYLKGGSGGATAGDGGPVHIIGGTSASAVQGRIFLSGGADANDFISPTSRGVVFQSSPQFVSASAGTDTPDLGTTAPTLVGTSPYGWFYAYASDNTLCVVPMWKVA